MAENEPATEVWDRDLGNKMRLRCASIEEGNTMLDSCQLKAVRIR